MLGFTRRLYFAIETLAEGLGLPVVDGFGTTITNKYHIFYIGAAYVFGR